MTITPKTSWPWVRTLLHSIYDQPDADSVVAQYDRVLESLTKKLPKVVAHLQENRADVLGFTAFPKRSGARSGPTIPGRDSIERSAAGPMWSASSPPATP